MVDNSFRSQVVERQTRQFCLLFVAKHQIGKTGSKGNMQQRQIS